MSSWSLNWDNVEVSYFKEPFRVTNATDGPTGLAGWMWSRDSDGSFILTFDNLEYVIPFAICDPCGKVMLGDAYSCKLKRVITLNSYDFGNL